MHCSVWLILLMAITVRLHATIATAITTATTTTSPVGNNSDDVPSTSGAEKAPQPPSHHPQHPHRHRHHRDAQLPGTSASSEPSAYHRLRHAERQRRRFKSAHRRQAAEGGSGGEDGGGLQAEAVFKIIRKLVRNDRRQRHHQHKDLTTKRERNEALCEYRRNTVHMNTPSEEFDPPFMVEIRCKNMVDLSLSEGRTTLRPQTCVHNLLRCVQTYKDVHFSRRKVGSNSWHPYTVPNVPSSCDCMWPVDKYGHQEL